MGETIPELLMRLRTVRCMSQRGAARLLGVHRQTYRDWESGKKRPSFEPTIRAGIKTFIKPRRKTRIEPLDRPE